MPTMLPIISPPVTENTLLRSKITIIHHILALDPRGFKSYATVKLDGRGGANETDPKREPI